MIEKDNAIDVLVHEIKQPLLCILVLGERMERIAREINPHQFTKAPQLIRDAEALLSSVQYMRTIIDARATIDYLTWVDTGWSHQLKVFFDSLEAIAADKHINLTIDNQISVREEGPDIDALAQIINNLFTNALCSLEKHEIKSQKNILIKIFEQNNYLHLEIHDNGDGIPEEFFSKIFNKGFTTKKSEIGSGYGLWICKKISEALGGTIQADHSNILSGACFKITTLFININKNTMNIKS